MCAFDNKLWRLDMRYVRKGEVRMNHSPVSSTNNWVGVGSIG
jgi:hypothetical protein